MERHTVKKLLTYGIILILTSCVIGYSVYQSKNLVAGPSIEIKAPKDGDSSTHSLIIIEGIVHNAVEIELNNRPIFIDEQGYFKEKVLLLPNINTITLRAKDKFGRNTTKSLRLVYLNS